MIHAHPSDPRWLVTLNAVSVALRLPASFGVCLTPDESTCPLCLTARGGLDSTRLDSTTPAWLCARGRRKEEKKAMNRNKGLISQFTVDELRRTHNLS